MTSCLQRGAQFLRSAETACSWLSLPSCSRSRQWCGASAPGSASSRKPCVPAASAYPALWRCAAQLAAHQSRSGLAPGALIGTWSSRSSFAVRVGHDGRVFLAHLALAQLVETQVGDDAVNPGVERALKAEIVDIAVSLQKGVLVNILRVLLGAASCGRQAGAPGRSYWRTSSSKAA